MLNNLCKGNSNNIRGSNIFHLRQLLNMAYLDSCTKKNACTFLNAGENKNIIKGTIYLIKNANLSKFFNAIPVPRATALNGSSAT